MSPRQARLAELGPGVDITKYVGGGVVAFSARSRGVRWAQHLDLSTEWTSFRAHVYGAPTLADLDGDGRLEVIVGTSMVGLCGVWGHRALSRYESLPSRPCPPQDRSGG